MFGMAVVCYLFLGGAGAGACAVLAVAGFFVPRDMFSCVRVDATGRSCESVIVPLEYQRLFSAAYAAALSALLIGMACLFVDLGRADRILLLLQPKLTYLAIGAYALVACVAVSVAAALMWKGFLRVGRVWVFRFVGGAQLILSLVVMLYTGLLLCDVRAVPLWSTPWLPALFAFSALSCGIALVMAADKLSEGSRLFSGYSRVLAKADLAVIVVEALVLAGFTLSIAAAGADSTPTAIAAASSLDRLLAGDLSVAFWGGFVICGLAAPLLIEVGLTLFGRDASMVSLCATTLVLVGGFALRWCIVEAGAHPVAMTLASGLL